MYGLPGYNNPKPKGMMKPKPSTYNKYGTTTFRVKNATYAKYGESMGVIQHTKNRPPNTRMTKTRMKSPAKALRASRALNVAGLGLLAAEGLYKGYKRAMGPGGREFHSQFVDYTSKPTNRGKRGVNY